MNNFMPVFQNLDEQIKKQFKEKHNLLRLTRKSEKAHIH